jgi:hypothetical protein
LLKEYGTLSLRERELLMKTIMLINIGTIILGVLARSFQRVVYSNREKITYMGQEIAAGETPKTFLMPSLWTGLILAGRNVLGFLRVRTKKKEF